MSHDRAAPAEVEEAALNASATSLQRWLDGWLLRFSPGKAKRARCIHALAPGRMPLADRLAAAERAYADAGLPMILRLTPWSVPDGLDGALAAAGLRRFDDTRVMLLPVLQASPETPPPQQLRLETLAAEPFAHRVGALRASPPALCAAHAARLREGGAGWQGLALQDGDGATLACGAVVVERGLAGLYDVHTARAARRSGLASWLCAELLRRAQGAGASRAYLQVEGDNVAARSIYHRLGFADAYAYHYRTRDPLAA